jgi:hypothetical protein
MYAAAHSFGATQGCKAKSQEVATLFQSFGSYLSDKFLSSVCDSKKHVLPNLFPDLAAAERKV